MTRELDDVDTRALLLGCTHYDDSPTYSRWFGVVVGNKFLNVCKFTDGDCTMCEIEDATGDWTEPLRGLPVRDILTGKLWCDEQ